MGIPRLPWILGLSPVLAAASLAVVWAAPLESIQDKDKDKAFSFAVIGDAPYSVEEETQFRNVLAEVNDDKRISFVLHVGDIQKGGAPCSDQILSDNLALFNTIEEALWYTPGDNEWKDCFRTGGDPLERLARIREVFFSTNQSFGHDPMTLIQQSAAYPENRMAHVGPVTIASLHVVGGNNNLPRFPGGPGNVEEYQGRNAANLQWLDATFTAARERRSRGVILFMQANPRFEFPPEQRTGFNDLLAALQVETAEFGKPVALLHGDTHYVRVDKPIRGALHFTRAETFGSPDVHWLRATVDPETEELFTFRPEIVSLNL